jgi:CubicO group peptidase (beta-lactamase class C family)
MSRLQTLKQRAHRGEVGVSRLRDGWWVGTGRGQGNCSGPHSRREAIQIAARWAMPAKEVVVVITMGGIQ